MPNKLLFVESNTTGTGMLALQKAAAMGMEPLFFTNNAQRYPELEKMGCCISICDTNNLEALQAAIEDQGLQKELCGVITTSEFYVETVAALACRYRLPGNPVEAIKSARNKALMRNILAQVGVLQPHFVVARDILGIMDGIRRLGLPLVLKPADDTGSNNVLLCQTEEQAKQHAERILAHQVNVRGQQTAGVVLAEEYIEGAEFSVEMLTWQGETHCIGITQKSLTGFPYFVEVYHLFPALLSMEQAESIRATVRQTLSALGIRNGITHTEVKWTPAGCMIIEVNPRPAGGMIPELVRLVTGIDMLEQYIRCAMNGPTTMQVRMQGVAGIQFLIADRQGVLQSCAGIERAANMADVILVKTTVQQGASVQPPQNAYHRLGYVIVHSEDATIAHLRLQEAISQIHLSIES